MTDGEFLTWMHNRLVHVYEENPNFDFVLRFKKIVDEVIKKEEEEEGARIVKEIFEKFERERKEWLEQFGPDDVFKPKAWECKKRTISKKIRYCEYKPHEDPACDSCIHCGHPYERK